MLLEAPLTLGSFSQFPRPDARPGDTHAFISVRDKIGATIVSASWFSTQTSTSHFNHGLSLSFWRQAETRLGRKGTRSTGEAIRNGLLSPRRGRRSLAQVVSNGINTCFKRKQGSRS